jgi:hypothetical protein
MAACYDMRPITRIDRTSGFFALMIA